MSTLAVIIRDAAFTRLQGMTVNSAPFVSTRKAPMLTVQNDQIPALGVYIAEEVETADGDADVSIPRYSNELTLAISMTFDASDPVVMDGNLDAAIGAAKELLLCDPTFLDLRFTDNSPIIEGVPRMRRATNYYHDGETYYAEARINIVFQYRSMYPPVGGVPLNTIVVVAGDPAPTPLVTQFDLT